MDGPSREEATADDNVVGTTSNPKRGWGYKNYRAPSGAPAGGGSSAFAVGPEAGSIYVALRQEIAERHMLGCIEWPLFRPSEPKQTARRQPLARPSVATSTCLRTRFACDPSFLRQMGHGQLLSI